MKYLIKGRSSIKRDKQRTINHERFGQELDTELLIVSHFHQLNLEINDLFIIIQVVLNLIRWYQVLPMNHLCSTEANCM